jgi:hypothetical protein
MTGSVASSLQTPGGEAVEDDKQPVPISEDPQSPFFGIISKHITSEQAAELEGKWRRLEVVQSVPFKKYRDEWLVVLRTPTRPEAKQWQTGLNSPNPQVKVDASETLFNQLVVFPDRSTVEQWAQTYPTMHLVAAHHMARLLGIEGDESGKS